MLLDVADFGALDGLGAGARITVHDVGRAIASFRERAPGESGVTSGMLKQLPECIRGWLADLFTACLSMGYFPTGLKRARVCMIPKSGNARGIEEFRPISLLETVGKVFERVINDRLMMHMVSNRLYGEFQFGFRSGRGTEMAIALCHERVAKTKANNGQAFMVLRDVSKAFDKVWHEGLKWKILRLGLPVCVERLLCSYIDNRRAVVVWGSETSAEVSLAAGVPQGGILSPTLYNIFVRDSPLAELPSLNIAYADDVTQCVVAETRNLRNALVDVRLAVDELNNFERVWKIRTNPNKFGLVPIARTPAKVPQIEVNGRMKGWNVSGRMLGWNFSFSKCNPPARMKEMARVGKSELVRLQRFRRLPVRVKRQLYCALVRSRITYPCVPLHCASDAGLRVLQRVQNAGVRFVTGESLASRISSAVLHHRAGLPALNVWLSQRAKGIWGSVAQRFPELLEALGDDDQVARKQT